MTKRRRDPDEPIEVAQDIGTGEIEITDVQEVDVQAIPVDAAGNPAPIEANSGVWRSADETIATVEAQPDDSKAIIRATGPVGQALVSFTGDADLGAGVVPIFGQLLVRVVADQAVGVRIETGEPRPQS